MSDVTNRFSTKLGNEDSFILDSGRSDEESKSYNVAKGNSSTVTVYASKKTGTIAGLSLIIEFSPDDINWYKSEFISEVRVDEENFCMRFDLCGASFFRVCSKEKSTIPSTVELRIDAV